MSVVSMKNHRAAKAPHPILQDALFCFAQGPDGASAELIRGWPALVAQVEKDVAGSKWYEILSDLDDWEDDGWGNPFLYRGDLEGDWFRIYRVATPAPQPTKGADNHG